MKDLTQEELKVTIDVLSHVQLVYEHSKLINSAIDKLKTDIVVEEVPVVKVEPK